MLSGPTMLIETKARLRASCNACNESKVRCSQSKPTCARCERNENECIYGLSRRTHKDAPPISSTSSQRTRKAPRSGGDSLPTSIRSNSTATSTSSNSPSTATIELNGYVAPDEPVETFSDKAAIFHDYMFPSIVDTDSTNDAARVLEFSGLVVNGNSHAAITPGYFSATRAEYADPTASGLEPLFTTKHNSDAMDVGTLQPPRNERKCTCHIDVTELLATMPSSSSMSSGYHSNNRRQPIDTQLAKLRQCIVSAETSMRCTHGCEDSEPIHIIAVAMLIGYAIDDFKTLASESSTFRSSSLSSSSSESSSMSSSSAMMGMVAADVAMLGNVETGNKINVTSPNGAGMSPRNVPEPRMSWGVLELEEDDEMDLRYRLCLLSFRKLERLILQFTTYTHNLHRTLVSLANPSKHMAFVIVCDYMRLWLEKKASDVKRLFSVPKKDEMMNSLFG